MAEAAVETNPLTNRFFCHQCSVEISPNLPDYTCPRCESGFIEEITQQEEEIPAEQNQVAPDPASQFAELFGRSFLQSFQHHANPAEPHLNPLDSDTDDERDLENALNHMDDTNPHGGIDNRHPNAQPFPLFNRIPGTRISIRTPASNVTGPVVGGDHRNLALQSILQSVLTGLMGGVLPASNQGTAGVGAQFPFGGIFGMYGSPGDYAWGTGGLDNIITQLLNQIDGAGPPPAEQTEIDKLTEVTISKEHIDKGLQCSVCMEDFKLEEPVKQLPCEHSYHKDCIVPWLELHGTCPVCRKPIAPSATHPHCDPGSPVSPDTTESSNSSPRSRSTSRSESLRSRSHRNDVYDDDEFD